MTDQELQQLNKWLAENVMGWKQGNNGQWEFDREHGSRYPLHHFTHWSPTTDMNQAMMCVEKWMSDAESKNRRHMKIDGFINWYRCLLFDEDKKEVYTTPNELESAPLAICQAIYEAFNG